MNVFEVYTLFINQGTRKFEETTKMKKVISLIRMCKIALAGTAFVETLKMGTNASFPPYEYYDDETGAIVSVDAEVAAAICEKLGYELEIVDMEFSSIIPAIVEKYIPPEKAEQFAKKQ